MSDQGPVRGGIPGPRDGLAGAWDRLVGPGMTQAETFLVVLAGLAGGALASLRMAATGAPLAGAALAGLAGADLIGGAVCNATATTRGWYHRAGQGFRAHMMFVAPHLLYVGAVAALARGPSPDLAYAAVLGSGLLGAAALTAASPPRLRPPVAHALSLGLLGVVLARFGPTRGLEWFEPALLLKLLVGHLAGPEPARRS